MYCIDSSDDIIKLEQFKVAEQIYFMSVCMFEMLS